MFSHANGFIHIFLLELELWIFLDRSGRNATEQRVVSLLILGGDFDELETFE